MSECQTNLIGSGDWVGAGRDLSDAPFSFERLGRNVHRHDLSQFQLASRLLRDGEHHIAGTLLCQANNGLPHTHHLPRLSQNRGDDARMRGTQLHIAALVLLHVQQGLGLLKTGLSRFERGGSAIEFRSTDEVLLTQPQKALVFGLCQIALGLSGLPLGFCRGHGQFQVAGVQNGQDLTRIHPTPQFDLARHQQPTQTKTQGRLHLGFDFASIGLG